MLYFLSFKESSTKSGQSNVNNAVCNRLPYDVINFEIDLMKDLGVKVGRSVSVTIR